MSIKVGLCHILQNKKLFSGTFIDYHAKFGSNKISMRK